MIKIGGAFAGLFGLVALYYLYTCFADSYSRGRKQETTYDGNRPSSKRPSWSIRRPPSDHAQNNTTPKYQKKASSRFPSTVSACYGKHTKVQLDPSGRVRDVDGWKYAGIAEANAAKRTASDKKDAAKKDGAKKETTKTRTGSQSRRQSKDTKATKSRSDHKGAKEGQSKKHVTLRNVSLRNGEKNRQKNVAAPSRNMTPLSSRSRTPSVDKLKSSSQKNASSSSKFGLLASTRSTTKGLTSTTKRSTSTPKGLTSTTKGSTSTTKGSTSTTKGSTSRRKK